MIRSFVTAALAMMLVGCGSAAGRLAPGALGVSARDAFTEARSVARVWSADARLRWVDGDGIDVSGVALPDRGVWQFHYTAPGHSRQLLVRVLPLETTSEERAPSSPPGFVIGDNALGTSWIDSRAVMQTVAAASPGAASPPTSMLLVPTRPEQWIVRGENGERWRIHAETGEVLTP